jgi:hypothetical protein
VVAEGGEVGGQWKGVNGYLLTSGHTRALTCKQMKDGKLLVALLAKGPDRQSALLPSKTCFSLCLCMFRVVIRNPVFRIASGRVSICVSG